MKGDRECEEHKCEGLKFCTWHPAECMGKPWSRNTKYPKRRGGVALVAGALLGEGS